MKQTLGRRHATGSHGRPAGPPLVTLTSDFGTGSPLVAAMKAVVLAGCPHATLVDVSHEVPRFDVFAGAFMLFAGTRHFGAGSVHMAVVDPGVGSSRRRLVIRAGGRFYVGPDNGLFGIVIDEVGMQKAAAQKLAAALQAAGQKKVGPEELCKLFKVFLAAETKMVKGLEEHSATCGVPPEVIKQVKTGHGKAAQMGKQVCEAAAQGPRQAAPTLSDALGTTPIVPDASTATKRGGGTFDTLTGSPLAQ